MEGNTLKTKRCSLCEEHKPTTEFHKGRKNPDGLHSYCKACAREKSLKRYHANSHIHKLRAKQWQINNPQRTIFNKKKGHAKAAGVPFTLTYELIHWPTHCPVLGLELEYARIRGGKSSSLPNSPSFDRIDPTKGYVDGNVIIVSNLANTIKSNATVDQLKKVAAFYEQLIPQEGSSSVTEDHRLAEAPMA